MMTLARFLSCTRGAAAAEMALIVPLAVLILFSSIEAGHYIYQEHQVVKGLRDGGRYAARQSFDVINCRGGSDFIDGNLVVDVQNLATTGKLSGGASRIVGWNPDEVDVEVLCPGDAGYTDVGEARDGIFDTSEPAPRVVVSTTINYNSLFNGLGVLTDSVSLNGSHQATVMGI